MTVLLPKASKLWEFTDSVDVSHHLTMVVSLGITPLTTVP